MSDAEQRRLRALDAFPPGHPSSPYLANGTRRPPRPNLRSLELPIPDEQRDINGPRRTADNVFGRSHDLANSDAPSQPEAEHDWYWTEVPRFASSWSDHVDKWPAERQPTAAVDRSRDAPGSWRSDSNLPLNPEIHSRAKDAIAGVREAEPRATRDLQHVVENSAHGGELVGLEFRCKGENRLKEKVAEKLRSEPDRAPEDAVRGIHDAIRYTVRLNSEDYVEGYTDISQTLESLGYTMYHCKNQWHDPEYKGINTRWITPEGQRFELQFHTPESYHAKQEVTHDAYERIRNRLTSDDERAELEAFQREVSSWIPFPKGAIDIPEHRKETF